MTISASLVAELRKKTDAGMMDCKKALVETNGDFEAAVEWLRKKGLSAAAKKSGRVAAEGLVSVAVSGNSGAILELNAETDFVSKNDKFQALVQNLAGEFLKSDGNLESFQNQKLANGKTISEEVAEHVAIIGENMKLRRAAKVTVGNGVVASYIHNATTPTMGKIGVLCAFETSIAADKVQQLGKQVAMHIAASKPESLSVADLDPALVEKEREFLKDQARQSGKPEAVIEKMIEGRVAKFYEQVVLLEQVFVMDGKTKVKDVIAEFGKQNGGSIELKQFVRFTLGEGVEKEEKDFAAEVAAAMGGN